MRIIRNIGLLLVCLVLLTACANSKEKVKTRTIKDSSGIGFISNQLIITVDKKASTKYTEDVVKKIEATIDNYSVLDLYIYTINLDYKEFKSLDEINKYCNELVSKYKYIKSCSANTISSAD